MTCHTDRSSKPTGKSPTLLGDSTFPFLRFGQIHHTLSKAGMDSLCSATHVFPFFAINPTERYATLNFTYAACLLSSVRLKDGYKLGHMLREKRYRSRPVAYVWVASLNCMHLYTHEPLGWLNAGPIPSSKPKGLLFSCIIRKSRVLIFQIVRSTFLWTWAKSGITSSTEDISNLMVLNPF